MWHLCPLQAFQICLSCLPGPLSFGPDNIPEDLRDPFYIDQYEQEHIKPPVTKLLLSSELYCRVCSLILKGDQVAALQGHQSVIQALSRKGIYVMESDDTPVTEPDLSHAPIKMVSGLRAPCPANPLVSCEFAGGGDGLWCDRLWCGVTTYRSAAQLAWKVCGTV